MKDWDRVGAIANVGALIVSIIVGGFGLFVAHEALNTSRDVLRLTQEIENLKTRPVLEVEYGRRSIKLLHLHGSPARIKSVTMRYNRLDGRVWLTYPEGSKNYNLWEFLGMEGINVSVPETLQSKVTHLWPDAVYGNREVIPLFEFPEAKSMKKAWKDRYDADVTALHKRLKICIQYVALDGRSFTSEDCGTPTFGDRIYRGRPETVHVYENVE